MAVSSFLMYQSPLLDFFPPFTRRKDFAQDSKRSDHAGTLLLTAVYSGMKRSFLGSLSPCGRGTG
jgi:hypothetical protein